MPADSALLDQSVSQITIFIHGESTGFTIRGDLSEENISAFNTPDLNQGVQAEIGLLEMTASPDGMAIQVRVSIYNYGTAPLTITSNDVSLTPAGGTASAAAGSQPSLPREVAPGKSEEFTFTFPRPAATAAILKVYTVEYEVEGY